MWECTNDALLYLFTYVFINLFNRHTLGMYYVRTRHCSRHWETNLNEALNKFSKATHCEWMCKVLHHTHKSFVETEEGRSNLAWVEGGRWEESSIARRRRSYSFGPWSVSGLLIIESEVGNGHSDIDRRIRRRRRKMKNTGWSSQRRSVRRIHEPQVISLWWFPSSSYHTTSPPGRRINFGVCRRVPFILSFSP